MSAVIYQLDVPYLPCGVLCMGVRAIGCWLTLPILRYLCPMSDARGSGVCGRHHAAAEPWCSCRDGHLPGGQDRLCVPIADAASAFPLQLSNISTVFGRFPPPISRFEFSLASSLTIVRLRVDVRVHVGFEGRRRPLRGWFISMLALRQARDEGAHARRYARVSYDHGGCTCGHETPCPTRCPNF